jgi:hypothetical protein
MDLKQGTLALAGAGALIDPLGWQSAVTTAAPVLAVCTVIIVIALCVTIIILVRSIEPSQRLAAIKALVPILLALASRLTSWLSAWRKS